MTTSGETPFLLPFKGSEPPRRPDWENALFEANTAEEIAAALAMRDEAEAEE